MTLPSYLKRLTSIFFNYSIIKRDQVSYPPYRLWVEPTAICNLRCGGCPNKELKKVEKGGFMDFDLFTKIINEAREYVHDINLHHRGESFLHPQLMGMIRYAKSKGIYTKLHTNGTKLDEDMSYQVLNSGLDLLSFSFDGYDKETYEKVRAGSNFEKTLNNVMTFLRIKKELKRSKPYTILEVIYFPDAEGDLSEDKRQAFERNFAGLSLDRFIVKRPHNWAGSISFRDQSRNGLQKSFSPCTFLWHSLVILWDGRVVPCPQDFFGEIIVGNVRSSGLREIFTGRNLTMLRAKMLRREINGLSPCFRCDILQRSTILGIPRQSLRFI